MQTKLARSQHSVNRQLNASPKRARNDKFSFYDNRIPMSLQKTRKKQLILTNYHEFHLINYRVVIELEQLQSRKTVLHLHQQEAPLLPRDGTSVANYTQVKYMNYLQLDKYTVLKYTPLPFDTWIRGSFEVIRNDASHWK